MAKKKGRSKVPESSDADDASSLASSSTLCSPAFGTGKGQNAPEVVELDQFEQYIEDTYEKRGTTREKAFEGLLEYLRSDVRFDDCENSEATILARCINSLRKGGAHESAVASQVLGHLVVTLGPAPSILTEIEPELWKVASQGKSAASQVAAIEALAMVCFISSDDDETTERIMQRFRSLFTNGEGKVKAAAIAAWSFLCTSLNSVMHGDMVETVLEELSDELHDRVVEVRTAAGEALALLYHSSGMQDVLVGQDDDDTASAVSGDTSMSGLDDALDRMKDLASNKGDKLRRSKREKATLRSAFRELCGIVEGGAIPVVKVKLQHGDLLVIDSLTGVIDINFFKRYLAGGFQVHLQHNQLLHDVFQFSPLVNKPDKLTALEKRAFKSPSSAASKDRTAQRKHERSHKASAMNW